MSTLSSPSPDLAAHCLRQVCFSDGLPAAQLSPTAGQSPRRLATLRTVELFLQPIDAKDPGNAKDTVNFVNPVGLAEWVRETLGDQELAEALSRIASSGRAYGFLVPELKNVISERLGQYEKALAFRDAAS